MQARAATSHAVSNPTLANIEKRWETMPPQEALRAFLYELVEHAVDSQSMAVALTTVMDLGSPVFGRGRTTMAETIGRLMAAAVATGAIRGDITPDTVFRAMGSVCAATGATASNAGTAHNAMRNRAIMSPHKW